MEMSKALEITQKLADGIDPASGEKYGEGSPYQQADTVRALCTVLEAVKRGAQNTARKKDGPAKAGKAWSAEEEQKMIKMFEAKTDVAQIAKVLCRTTGAIWARLEKLGKVKRNEEGKWVRVNKAAEANEQQEPSGQAQPASASAGFEF